MSTSYVMIKGTQIINVVVVDDLDWLNERVADGTCDSYDTLLSSNGVLKYTVLQLPQDL